MTSTQTFTYGFLSVTWLDGILLQAVGKTLS